MVNLILPKTYISQIDFPLIFLMGPIRGAPRWQDEAIEIIDSLEKEIIIASPSIRLREEYLNGKMRGSENRFSRQTYWERYYLNEASTGKFGSILTWLPAQVESIQINSETGFPQPYARDTRGELGAYGWGILKNNPKFPIVVGAKEKFDGLSVIKANFLEAKPDFHFYSTLVETCSAAVNLAKIKR